MFWMQNVNNDVGVFLQGWSDYAIHFILFQQSKTEGIPVTGSLGGQSFKLILAIAWILKAPVVERTPFKETLASLVETCENHEGRIYINLPSSNLIWSDSHVKCQSYTMLAIRIIDIVRGHYWWLSHRHRRSPSIITYSGGQSWFWFCSN